MSKAIKSNVYQINRAISNTLNEVLLQRKQIILNASSDYKIELQTYIMTEKFADASWVYSESYKDYKSRVAPNQPYWKLSGDLFNAITNKKTTGFNRFVGIPSTARNSNGDVIAKYALRLEYGDKKSRQPPRPVFAPTLEVYFNGNFQKRIDKSIQDIMNKWKI